MAKKGEVRWVFIAETGQWVQQVKKVEQGFLGLTGQAAKFAKLAVGGLGAATAVSALKRMSSAVIVSNVEFERLTTQIKTLTVGGGADLKRFNASLVEMASATATGPQELAKALFFVESAGIRGAAAMETTRIAAGAAQVGLGESAVIARTLVSAMNAYSASNLGATETVDTLIEIVRQGGAEATEYATALGRILPVAAALGVSFQEVGAFMAVFTKAGGSASEAASGLRGALLALTTPGPAAAKAMEKVDLSAAKLRDSLRTDGLQATLEMLMEAFDGNIEVMKKVIPRVEGMAAVLAVAGSQAEGYREAIEGMSDVTGNFAEVTEASLNTVGGQWGRLSAILEAKFIAPDSFLGQSTVKILKFYNDIIAGADLAAAAVRGVFGAGGSAVLEYLRGPGSGYGVSAEWGAPLGDYGPTLEQARGAPSPPPSAEAVEAAAKAVEALDKAERELLETNRQALSAELELMRARESMASGDFLAELDVGLGSTRVTAESMFDEILEGFGEAGVEADQMADGLKKVETVTIDWAQALENAANQMVALGGAGKVLGQIMGGIAGIGSGISMFNKGKDVGGIGGFFAQVSGGLGIAGAAIGIGKAIFGLFKSDPVEDAQKEAGKLLGMGISQEMAEQFVRQAEQTGQSIEAVAQQWFDQMKQALRDEGMSMAMAGLEAQVDALGGAPQYAEIAARNFNTTFWEHVKDKGLPAALDAFGSIFAKLREAYGDELPPGFGQLAKLFRLMDDPAIASQLQFAQGQAQFVGGATRAGFFDPSMTQDSVNIANDTLSTLRDSGVTDQQGYQMISGLLQAELNAAIVAGRQVDAGLQRLLDEARANNVQILPSIAAQQLDVLKKIYGSVSGGRTYVPPGGGAVPGLPIRDGGGRFPTLPGGTPIDPRDLYPERRMAEGGIVTAPTRALIGERGSEVVLPLGDLAQIGPELAALRQQLPRDIARAVRDAVSQQRGGA